MKKIFLTAALAATVFFSSKRSSFALPEYAAYSGMNCMACHVGPIGGFGRKPLSMNDLGYITDKVALSGDFRFMALYDQRQGSSDRVVMFPMEAALHLALKLKPTFTISMSQDYGMLREAYAMLHNEDETMYVRAGFFTLPYGLMFDDHTAFVKEGRVKTGTRTFEEEGTGAGLFSVRYKDSGIEAGLSGRPWFLNLAMTSGVVGQEERAMPSNQSGTKRAITRRAGFMNKNFCLGGSMYTNDNELLDRRILRYGGFGWVHAGPFALIFEHDEGEEEAFTVAGSTQLAATYVEFVYRFKTSFSKTPTWAKLRYERLDPNRSLNSDVLQRWVASYRFSPTDYMSIESFYRNNREQPVEVHNDDIYVIAYLYF